MLPTIFLKTVANGFVWKPPLRVEIDGGVL
jgi:hypothetical protein